MRKLGEEGRLRLAADMAQVSVNNIESVPANWQAQTSCKADLIELRV